MESRQLNGRSALYTDAEEVTAQNVQDVIEDVSGKWNGNQGDISYLYDYYRGIQPILDRTKTYNKEICNKVVENRAKEISDFKTGYLLSAPIQYIDARANDSTETMENSDIARLMEWMRSEGKDASDMEVAFWQSVCGTAYRMVSPRDGWTSKDATSPFQIIVLDPRYTYVVYSSSPDHRPMLGVTYYEDKDGNRTTYAYTDTSVFVIDKDGNVSTESHQMGRMPIVEYPSGPTRLGDFEPVVPMLDAINTTQSSRIDGVEQFVQAIMVLEGMDPGDLEQFLTDVKEMGAFRMPTGGKASYLTLDMDQTSTQTLVDGMYNAVLKICGMPNPHAGYNTQDTGAAVILRDGWSATEAVASRTETWFKRSERAFLDMAIDFCDIVGGLHLEHRDVGIMFPRRNYTNDSANVDNLVKLLSLDWISPEQAFEHSNMFPDPHSEFLRAKAWHDEQETRDVTSLADVNAGREEYASSWKETDDGGEEQQQQQGAIGEDGRAS